MTTPSAVNDPAGRNDVSLGSSVLAWMRRERSTLVPLVAFAVLALNFNVLDVIGSDGHQYLSFAQRLWGDRARGAGYNFGVGLLNAPFYGLGKLAASAWTGAGRPLTSVGFALAGTFWGLVAAGGTAWLLRRLRVPHPGTALMAAVFGTPLFYYSSLEPYLSHAVDAALFTAAAAALLVALESRSDAWLAVAGGACGAALTVRALNIGLLAGAVVGLWLVGRRRAILPLAGGALAVAALFAVVPVALHVKIGTAIDGHVIGRGNFGFFPLNPVRMLVTDHRGLFVWTPITLLATLGVVLALRTRSFRKSPLDVQFLLIITLMTVGLLVMYTFFRVWDGQWSYSSRFLTSPLPLYALGVASFMKRVGSYRIALPVVCLCTAWAVYLGLAHAFGHVDQQESATSAAATYVGSPLHPKDFLDALWSYSRVRHLLP